MYRAVTWAALSRGLDLEDEDVLAELAWGLDMAVGGGGLDDRLIVDGQDITDDLTDPKVEGSVSVVARVSGVRTALVEQQRDIAATGGIVMVGRDIGTVVVPDAPVKVFLNASVQVRSQRRYLEVKEHGATTDYQLVVDDLERRDKMDRERTDSPLRAAKDAIQMETDDLGVEEVVEKILVLVERAE